MPYIKSISIRNNVKSCLKYIANLEKTQNGVLVTGVNCSDNINVAEKEMCLTYQNYSHKNFYDKLMTDKSPIKSFHFVQSFKGDECDSELAHKIGQEWVKKAFGENFQAVITTHNDTGNVHNHICICPYDLNGMKFNSNKKSLAYVREISDEICRRHGIVAMEKKMAEENHTPVGVTYGEWIHSKQGTSWKDIIRRKVDLLIGYTKSLAELLEELEQQGYTVKRGKYISVKAPNLQRAVRLKTLGADYTEENISRRIQKRLDVIPKIRTISEIISQVMDEFKQQAKQFSFAKSVKNSIATLGNQLCFISQNNITSISQAEDKLKEVEQLSTQTQNEINELNTKKEFAEKMIKSAERYFKKYGVFEKNKLYPKSEQLKDKALLLEYGIAKFGDIEDFKANILEYDDKITSLQGALNEVNSSAESYRDIIETYKKSSETDYISKLVKLARDKMDEQETAHLKMLERTTYELYYRHDENYTEYRNQEIMPNTDDYFAYGGGDLIDIEGDSFVEKLENIYAANRLPIGAVILIQKPNEEKAVYVDSVGFKLLPDFKNSRAETLRLEQECIEKLKRQEEQKTQNTVKRKSGCI